jgi:Domain of unknown function (DUF4129)
MKSSTFSKLASPAATAVIVAEATWISLLLSAVAAAGYDRRVSLPFLALALPGVVALVSATTVVHLVRTKWGRAALLAPVWLVGAALTAGVIGELAGSGWFVRIAFEPWSASGGRMTVTAVAAWAAAVVIWGRGLRLALVAPSLRDAGQSVAAGAVVYVAILVGRTQAHHDSFASATAASGWLLLVWFGLAATSLALVHERDLEHEILHRTSAQPNTTWLTVLAAPLAAIALVALLFAAVLGSAWSKVLHALGLIPAGIWSLIKAIGGASKHARTRAALTHVRPRPARPTKPHHHLPKLKAAPIHRHAILPGGSVIWLAIGGLLLLVVVVFVIRSFWPVAVRRRRSRQGDLAENEQRDSVFSWRHLAQQAKHALFALLARLRRSRPLTPATKASAGASAERRDGRPETVRDAYRQVLANARVAGAPRAPTETTGELCHRLAVGPASAASGALTDLTNLYDAARYGELDADEPTRSHAIALANSVNTTLGQQGSPRRPA